MKLYDIVIIGAGPAGIMAAISASGKGKSILVIEKNDKVGKKLLATGNGRCNLTNTSINSENYYSDNPYFVDSIIGQFDQNETMRFFEKLGVILKVEENGRVFPRTNQASTILHVLVDRMKQLNIEVWTNKTVVSISKNDRWEIDLNDNQTVHGRRLMITTGGKAAHFLGSSGDGLYWSEKIGHTISPIHAALVPINTEEKWPSEISGLKVSGIASIVLDNKSLFNKNGDILFTHFGLSGPAIMGLSRHISELLADGKNIKIVIDLFPEESIETLDGKLKNIFNLNGAKQLKNTLIGMLPHNLIGQILKIATVNGEKKSAEITKVDRKKIVFTLKNVALTPSSTRPLKEAQVSAGGVLTKEVNNKTLESKICPDLFFAGEILNVDGDSGGYNLQWAWSSGYVAGKNISL